MDTLASGQTTATGCRLNHARGLLVEGVFKPSKTAAELSVATTFSSGDQPMLARFSSASGDPEIAQDDARANPRGLAIRLGDATDRLILVGHSIEAFPAADPAEFLDFIEALNEGSDDKRRLQDHMSKHLSAQRFNTIRPGSPASFASLDYHMLHAYRLAAGDGQTSVGRLIVSGLDLPMDSNKAASGPDYLDRDLRARLNEGVVELRLIFQPWTSRHRPPDLSAPWPDKSRLVTLGRIIIQRPSPMQVRQKSLVFDPSTLPLGVDFAGDEMIATRVAAYTIAASRRLDEAPAASLTNSPTPTG